MNCTNCQDTGWLCEEHPEQMQSHLVKIDDAFGQFYVCNGAGVPCTCEAFPHRTITPKTAHLAEIGVSYRLIADKVPREFWISTPDDSYPAGCVTERNIFEGQIHVREVIEISEAEIKEFIESPFVTLQEQIALEAGARWAINKMRGGE